MKRLFSILLLTLFAAKAAAIPVTLYGLNYNTRQGPDWDPDKCKNREQILEELTVLQKLTNRIRILSLSDCGQGELVLSVAKELGLQIWLGLWVSADEYVFLQEKAFLQDFLTRGLIDDSVLGISVGSESIYRKEVNVTTIIDYEDQVKELLVDAGKSNIPLSICDIEPTYEANPQLVDAVDLIVTNSFPFWESVPVEDATDYLLLEMTPLFEFGKDVLMGETGWPSGGYNSGVGSGSPEDQAQFFTQFFCRMDKQLNWKYFYFTGFDEPWRQEQDPNNTIEGTWGIFYPNLTLKEHFQDLVFTCDSSVEYSFSEIDWTLPTFTAAPTITSASPAVAVTNAPSEENGSPTASPTTDTTSTPTTEATNLSTKAPTVAPSATSPSPTMPPTVAPSATSPSPTMPPTAAPSATSPSPTMPVTIEFLDTTSSAHVTAILTAAAAVSILFSILV